MIYLKNRLLRKFVALYVAVCFIASMGPAAFAADMALPAPKEFVQLSGQYSFPVLKGIKFDPQNPLDITFVVDTGSKDKVSKEESAKLIKYFLAGLTTPDQDLG